MRKSKTKDIKRIQEKPLVDFIGEFVKDSSQLKLKKIEKVGTFEHAKQGYILRYNKMCDKLGALDAETLRGNGKLLGNLCVVYNQLRRPWVGKLGLELNQLARQVDRLVENKLESDERINTSPTTVTAV